MSGEPILQVLGGHTLGVGDVDGGARADAGAGARDASATGLGRRDAEAGGKLDAAVVRPPLEPDQPHRLGQQVVQHRAGG